MGCPAGKGKANASLPRGLQIGAAPNSSATGPIERNGSSSGSGTGTGDGDDPRLVASANVRRTGANAKPLVPVADDKVTETDRQVFGGRRIYSMTLNMPNLGHWQLGHPFR